MQTFYTQLKHNNQYIIYVLFQEMLNKMRNLIIQFGQKFIHSLDKGFGVLQSTLSDKCIKERNKLNQ